LLPIGVLLSKAHADCVRFGEELRITDLGTPDFMGENGRVS
jgi:hypothetical protein